MKTKHIEFEGNFGSQDPALQPTAEDFAAISHYIAEQKRRRAAVTSMSENRSYETQGAVLSQK